MAASSRAASGSAAADPLAPLDDAAVARLDADLAARHEEALGALDAALRGERYRVLLDHLVAASAAELESVLELAMSPQTRAFELAPDGTWHLNSARDPEHPTRHLQNTLLRRIVDRAE